MSLFERWSTKIEFTPTCWLWTGSRNPSGYGILGVSLPSGRHTTVGAHRVAWRRLVGAIPDGAEVDHLCRVRHCVNPDHLELVDHAENMRRGSRANQTHCHAGHALPAESNYIGADGPHRICRECQKQRNRAYRELRSET